MLCEDAGLDEETDHHDDLRNQPDLFFFLTSLSSSCVHCDSNSAASFDWAQGRSWSSIGGGIGSRSGEISGLWCLGSDV
jgi:hypothetical protein